MILCTGCQSAICTDELMCVIERKKFWHTRCLRCSECSKPLEDRCFYRNNRMYCPNDFYRVFGRNCAVCGGLVKNRQRIRMLGGKYFHENCFGCAICTNKFNTGDTFHTVQDKLLLCTDDYKSLKRSYEEMMAYPATKNAYTNSTKRFCASADKSRSVSDRLNSASSESISDIATSGNMMLAEHEISNNSSDCESEMEMQINEEFDNSQENGAEVNDRDNNVNGTEASKSEKSEQTDDDGVKNADKMTVNGKKRGPRTTIKAKQLEMLKVAFTTTPKPTRHAREQLAVDTGLNMRVIQVWFQNRRSKERRMRQMTIAATRRHWAMRNFSHPNGIPPQFEITEGDMMHMYPQMGPNFFGQHHIPQFQDMYCPEFYDQPPDINGQQNPHMQQMMQQQYHCNPIINIKNESNSLQIPTVNLPNCTGAPMPYQQFVNPEYPFINNNVPPNTFSNPVDVFDPTLTNQANNQLMITNGIKRVYDIGQPEMEGNRLMPALFRQGPYSPSLLPAQNKSNVKDLENDGSSHQMPMMGNGNDESPSDNDELDIDTLLLQGKQKKK